MGTRNILLVDDEPDVLKSLATLFDTQAPHCNVRTAASAREALGQLDDCDIILSDHRMPGMTGVEFLTRVRETHPHILRVLLTAHSDVDIAIAALERAAVHYYLRKPCDAAELLNLLERTTTRPETP